MNIIQNTENFFINDLFKRNYLPYLLSGKKSIELVFENSEVHWGCICHNISMRQLDSNYIDNFNKIIDWYLNSNLQAPIILDGMTNEILNSLNFSDSIQFQIPLLLENNISEIFKPNIQYKYYCKNPYTIDVNSYKKIYLIVEPDNIKDVITFLYKKFCDHLINDLYKYQLVINWHAKWINNITELQELNHLLFTIAKEIYNKTDLVKWFIGEKELTNFCSFVDRNTFNGHEDLWCGMQKRLTIDISSMGIYMCPEIIDPTYEIGKVTFENNQILLKSTTVEQMIFKDYIQKRIMPGCDVCEFIGSCQGCCLANEYRLTGVMGIPSLDICKIYSTLIQQSIKDIKSINLQKEIVAQFNGSQARYLEKIFDCGGQNEYSYIL